MALKTVEVKETYKVPDLAGRAQKGVKLLDKKLGPEWVKKVDPRSLDLGDGATCVVGQLAIQSMLNGPLDGYYDGIKKVFKGRTQAEYDRQACEHGFLVTTAYTNEVEKWLAKQPMTHPWWPLAIGKNGENLDLMNVLYDYLTAIWVQIIKARRAALRPPRKAPAKTAVKTAKKTTAKKTVAKKATKSVAR